MSEMNEDNLCWKHISYANTYTCMQLHTHMIHTHSYIDKHIYVRITSQSKNHYNMKKQKIKDRKLKRRRKRGFEKYIH